MKGFKNIPPPRDLRRELEQAENAIARADKHKRNQLKKKRYSPDAYASMKPRTPE